MLKSLVVLLLPVVAFAANCNFNNAIILGEVEDGAIDEASGLAASRINPDILYTHNDHGQQNRFFAMRTDGSEVGMFFLEGIALEDTEDIAVGAGPDPSISYIYLADIGNNDYNRINLQIYRFPEPQILKNGDIRISNEQIETLVVESPVAPIEDMETFMLDPITGYGYILTKNHDDDQATIYKFDAVNAPSNFIIPLEEVGSIDKGFLVAGDISVDGSRIAIRAGKNRGAWYYTRDVASGQTVEDALVNPSAEACDLVLEDEIQGESLAIAADDSGFYTTSEEQHQPIYFYGF